MLLLKKLGKEETELKVRRKEMNIRVNLNEIETKNITEHFWVEK